MAKTLKECPVCGTMLLMKSNQKCCRGARRQKAMKLRAAAGAAALYDEYPARAKKNGVVVPYLASMMQACKASRSTVARP